MQIDKIVEFLTKSKQIRTKLEVKYMLIKSKILYMDDDHYYLTPIPSYLYSVFAITEETLPQYEKDCNIEINYTITRETTIQEIQNALCKKMSKQVGLVCRNYFGIYLRTDSDFICIEDTAINVEHVLDLFHIKDVFVLFSQHTKAIYGVKDRLDIICILVKKDIMYHTFM